MNGRVVGRVGQKGHISHRPFREFAVSRRPPGAPARLGMQALQRTSELADIGSVGAFLASDDACGIIGDTIRIDGGSKL